MSEPSEKLLANISTVRAQLAKAEASVETLRHKLAKLEAKAAGTPIPITGLDILWKAAVPMARTRSTKFQCRQEWNKIPHADRPPVAQVIEALKIWNRCEEWKKDGNAYVPGLHRWIKNRQWEDLPEISAERDVAARYRVTPKPIRQPDPDAPLSDDELPATAADIAAMMAPLQSMFQSTRVKS